MCCCFGLQLWPQMMYAQMMTVAAYRVVIMCNVPVIADLSCTHVPEKKRQKKTIMWAGKHVCCFGSQLWLKMTYAHNYVASSSYYV